jgi:hypothetical protein
VSLQALVDARNTRLPLDEIQNKLKTQLPPGYQRFGTEGILRAAYRSQVEREVLEALTAGNTGCIIVLLSCNTFMQGGSFNTPLSIIQENSLIDSQLKVCWLCTDCVSHRVQVSAFFICINLYISPYGDCFSFFHNV